MREPSYIELYDSGELRQRTKHLVGRLSRCDLCPRRCGSDRVSRGDVSRGGVSRGALRGFCGSGAIPVVSSFGPHFGEEPVLSGERGVGNVFFQRCNMRCAYCQNHQISQDDLITEETTKGSRSLSLALLALQKAGCHFAGLVSPTHFLPAIMKALCRAIPQGFRLPLLYNTSGYESTDALKQLEGVIQVYLPDLRYSSEEAAIRYSEAPGYVGAARRALREMRRQVGSRLMMEDGMLWRGLIIRILVLPGDAGGVKESLRWIAGEMGTDVAISIMSQYYPSHRASFFPEINRVLSESEYRGVLDLAGDLGFSNGFTQELSARDHYRPDFRKHGNPFDRGACY